MKRPEEIKQPETLVSVGSVPLNLSLKLALLAFFVPALLPFPQWLTGMLVNALLFIAAEKLSFKKQLPVIILPSIGAFTHGIIFGPLTVFLLYFLPFIWLGNAILVKAAGSELLNKWPVLFRVFVASTLKAAFLFLAAYFYVHFHLVPLPFLSSMGIFQFFTAVAGGFIVYSFQGVRN